MLELTNEQIQKILNQKSTLENGIDEVLKMAFTAIMYGERQAYLREQKNPENRANGYRSTKINVYARQLALCIPRDKLSKFKPLLLAALKEQEQEAHKLCYELYIGGMSTRRISSVFKKIYGKHYSQSTISNILQTFKEGLEAWRSRMLEKRYLVIYLDVIDLKVRRDDRVQPETFYIAVGVKKDYSKEVIAITSNPTESASGLENVLENIKKRGVDKINLVVADRIKDLEEKVHKYYPNASLQKSVTHLKRHIISKIRSKDQSVIMEDLSCIFDITDSQYTKEEVYKVSKQIVLKWEKKYPFIKDSLSEENIRSYFTNLNPDFKVTAMVYTSLIEKFTKEFKIALKVRRNTMPTIDSILLLLSAIACDM